MQTSSINISVYCNGRGNRRGVVTGSRFNCTSNVQRATRRRISSTPPNTLLNSFPHMPTPKPCTLPPNPILPNFYYHSTWHPAGYLACYHPRSIGAYTYNTCTSAALLKACSAQQRCISPSTLQRNSSGTTFSYRTHGSNTSRTRLPLPLYSTSRHCSCLTPLPFHRFHSILQEATAYCHCATPSVYSHPSTRLAAVRSKHIHQCISTSHEKHLCMLTNQGCFIPESVQSVSCDYTGQLLCACDIASTTG
jgi:hypothetical protein